MALPGALTLAGLSDHERVEVLTSRLGLAPGSLRPGLALQALRHGSYAHERGPGEALGSNERLEFLGDAVLGMAVAQRCYDLHPGAPEGELTRLRASIVREESLAIVARSFGLGELLLLGRGENRTGGRDSATRLADAVEAVLAAVFLSCGMAAVQEVIERLFAPIFEQAAALGRDPKTELQQILQARRRSASYHVLTVSGPDHAREFEVEVRQAELPLGRGRGRSKKEAEQAAARAVLDEPLAIQRALVDEEVVLAEASAASLEIAAAEGERLRILWPGARIEHVGTTAVPGLTGTVAIDLVAPDVAARPSGYEDFGEVKLAGTRFLRRRAGTMSFHLLLVAPESGLVEAAVALRELLRARPEEARALGDASRALLDAGARTLIRYWAAKAPLLRALQARAQESLT